MRKLSLAVSIIFLVSLAGATTIQDEEVTVDLADSSVHVDIKVKELTSSKFSYITSYSVSSVSATSNGEKLECDIQPLQIGSEIKCEPPRKQNFTVSLDFRGNGFVTSQQSIKKFDYTQSIYRPTDRYSLKVILPKGAGILEDENVSTAVINPPNAEKGSNGRRIFVKWTVTPELGETLQFQAIYEDFGQPVDYLKYGIIAAIVLFTGFLSYLGFRRFNRENIENIYGELSDDQLEVIELLRENDGQMLQKDVVEKSDYSKAKISGVVSELVEEEIIVKEKKGRSNQLSISKNYRA
ncbi:MAG: helix-turn-helix transcriptional regulator [Candidatus Nanosalina sp.]